MKSQALSTLVLLAPLLDLATAAKCNRDKCLRAVAAVPTKASAFCSTYTATTYTETTAPTIYASVCANSPSKISSACSCVVTSPPSCTPSAVIQGPIRNGGFDSYAIPPGESSVAQPPWYYDRQTNAYGDFQLEGPGTYFGEGAAAFHLQGQQPGVLPGAIAYLNAPITYCNGVTYSFSLYARQIPAPSSNSNYQNCRLSFFTSYAGSIGSWETPAFSDQFTKLGPVTWTVYRDNGDVNAKGEYSDILSIIVQCTGVQGKVPLDTLFEVDSVMVVVAS